ncbi:MAG TPA: hypothetical protein VMT02_00175 [Burkholderiales bacterium]|nr:hypothetical protein [Burkholderiales bacterium]
MRAALLLLMASAPALAQDAGVQRELMQRRQATDAFELQLRQSQEALKAPPAARGETEARQRSERQRLENVSSDQLRDVKPDAQLPPQLRPYEMQKTDTERAPFRGPIVEVPARPAPKPEPIVPPRDGIRLDPQR